MSRPTIPLLLASLAIVAAIIFVGSRYGHRTETRPQLNSRNPTTIDLAIFGEFGEQIATVTNTDALLSLLRGGRRVQPHACAAAGRLIFHYSDGAVEQVLIHPGHTKTNYEFTCAGEYFAVPRVAFMSALASGGVDTNKIPTE